MVFKKDIILSIVLMIVLPVLSTYDSYLYHDESLVRKVLCLMDDYQLPINGHLSWINDNNIANILRGTVL